jgi:hypothetical protein
LVETPLYWELGKIMSDEIPQIPEAWEPLPESPLRRIVCAAWKHNQTGRVILCIRHGCPFVYDNQDVRGGNSLWKGKAKSGFVDQYGKFWDREDAWKIAEAAGQIRNVNIKGMLFSENLY